MARRKITSEQRKSLADSLRKSSRDGSLLPGSLLPTVRELSEHHNLSRRIVSNELQILIDEGILYTVPRVGTFVGRPVSRLNDFYLLLFDRPIYVNRIRVGFEERIAELGASSLVLPIEEALEYRQRGELPKLSGVFDFVFRPDAPVSWPHDDDVHYMVYATTETKEQTENLINTDTIHFDNVGAGALATQHLIQLGHKQIAFLGLHNAERKPGLYTWSARREEGWISAMSAGGIDTAGLSFLPAVEPEDSVGVDLATGAQVARRLVGRRDISAVVCANDWAAMGLFNALRVASVAQSRWPSVVGFDNLHEAEKTVLTSMRVPWEDLGRAAAHTLFLRKMGTLTGPPVERIIPLKLIPRLSSRQHNEGVREYLPQRIASGQGLEAKVY